MKIQNLHQPYIFKHNNSINIVVSEFVNKIFSFKYGSDDAFEDYWKLCILDSNYNKTTIITPSTIEFEQVTHTVIAECNGYINDGRISYVIGVHEMQDQKPLKYFLVEGDFDMGTKIVSNLSIVDRVRTGFIKDNKYVLDTKDNTVLVNDIVILDCGIYLDNVVRIIPVYGENKILFTGETDGVFKTFIFDITNNEVKIVEGADNKNIYKSSVLSDNGIKIFAYTDKVFVGKAEVDYVLNIEDEYTLVDPTIL